MSFRSCSSNLKANVSDPCLLFHSFEVQDHLPDIALKCAVYLKVYSVF